jgi:hypothetical protein
MGGAIDVDEGSTANIIDTTPSPATRPPSRVVRLRRRAGSAEEAVALEAAGLSE